MLDLRSIVPWDKAAIEESVRRTGRLVVVQEDTENCSVGQMIITHIASQPDIWSELVSPPMLVSKGNVMIGYNPIYEYAALPDVERIVAAVKQTMSFSADARRRTPRLAPVQERAEAATAKAEEVQHKAAAAQAAARRRTSPSRSWAKAFATRKSSRCSSNPATPIELDDPLCELETDKAVYPIESSFAGTMGEWKTEVGATVDIGQELGTILTAEGDWEEPIEAAAKSRRQPAAERRRCQTAARQRQAAPASSRQAAAIEPAFRPRSFAGLAALFRPTCRSTRAGMRSARRALRRRKPTPKSAATPSVMVAWAVVRAMEKHAPFRRIMLEDDSIVEHDEFDLGIAVSLENDRLATAVVTRANKRDWPDFVQPLQRDRRRNPRAAASTRSTRRSSSAASALSACVQPRRSSSRLQSGRSSSAPRITRWSRTARRAKPRK